MITHDATRDISYGLQLFEGNLERFEFDATPPPYSPLVYPPGYPFLIGLTNQFLNDPVLSAYMVSMVMASLLSLTVFYLAKELFNAEIAYLSLLMCGIYPGMVQFAVSTYIRSTAMFFLLFGMYLFLLAIRKREVLLCALSGMVIGLAILTRFEFAIYGMLLAIVLLVRITKRKLGLNHFMAFLLTLSLVYSIYAVPLYICSGFKIISPVIGDMIFGRTVPSKPIKNNDGYKKFNLSMRAHLFNGNSAVNFSLNKQRAVRVSKEDWAKYDEWKRLVSPKKSSTIEKYRQLFERILPGIFGGVFRMHLILLFTLGGFYCLKRIQTPSWILFSVVAVTLVFYPLGSTWSVRYYSHLQPFFLLVGSCGLYLMVDVVRKRFANGHLSALITLVFLSTYVYKDIQNIQRHHTPQELVWVKCAEYLKTSAKPDCIVVARKHYPAFYSGLRMAWLPDEDNLNDVWEYVRNIEADYILIDHKLTVTLMPQYGVLLENHVPPFLRIEKEFFGGSEYFTRIFKVLNTGSNSSDAGL